MTFLYIDIGSNLIGLRSKGTAYNKSSSDNKNYLDKDLFKYSLILSWLIPVSILNTILLARRGGLVRLHPLAPEKNFITCSSVTTLQMIFSSEGLIYLVPRN